jgi:hypothetical protein
MAHEAQLIKSRGTFYYHHADANPAGDTKTLKREE